MPPKPAPSSHRGAQVRSPPLPPPRRLSSLWRPPPHHPPLRTLRPSAGAIPSVADFLLATLRAQLRLIESAPSPAPLAPAPRPSVPVIDVERLRRLDSRIAPPDATNLPALLPATPSSSSATAAAPGDPHHLGPDAAPRLGDLHGALLARSPASHLSSHLSFLLALLAPSEEKTPAPPPPPPPPLILPAPLPPLSLPLPSLHRYAAHALASLPSLPRALGPRVCRALAGPLAAVPGRPAQSLAAAVRLQWTLSAQEGREGEGFRDMRTALDREGPADSFLGYETALSTSKELAAAYREMKKLVLAVAGCTDPR